MPTLAQTLATTTPVSALLRKARRLGLRGVDALIALAVSRGCLHYAAGNEPVPNPPPREALGDDELTILLLCGENSYESTAIRCAAQLARSSRVEPARLARLAVMENVERSLAHIARAGIAHDTEGRSFWQDVLNQLPAASPRSEPDLPHWSRFVSMPGRQRRRHRPDPLARPQRSLPSALCPLPSALCPLASGLWPLASGLWPLASGLWPLASDL